MSFSTKVRETLTSAGVIISLISTLIIGTYWLSSQFADMKNRFDRLETKMADQWTETEMENWSLKLKIQNSALNVPDIR